MKKVKNKQKTILFFLITFLFSITIGLLPSPIITPRVSAENLDESKSTYKDIKTLSATAYRCLEEDILDMEGRDIKAFKDIFHNRNYALGGGVLGVNQSINGYDAERAVVGFVVDPSNGVQTCKTVLDRSLKILDRESGSNGVAKALVNTTDFGNPIPRARLKTRAGELRGDIIKKMSALKKSMSSAHYRYWSYYDSLSPDGSLANTCYQVGGQSPTGSFNSSRDIEIEVENGTSHVLYYRGDEKKAGGEDKISDRAYKDTGWLVDNGGVAATTTIGDIFVRLGGKKEGVGGGHPNYWSTPFFPWSMTSSDNADDETEGLISCSLVKTHLEDVGAEFLTVKKGQILLTPKPITSPENAVTIDKALKDKQDDIKPLLEANPDIMYFCTGSIRDKYANELGTSLRNEASTIDYFTKWLAAYGTTTVVSVPWTLDEGKKMVECLVNDNAYGDELFTIMKRETEGLQDVDPTAADKKPAADEPQNCKGGVGTIDAALGWFICPVVDMIFGVIHFLETNIILPYLAVSPLEDKGAIFDLWTAVRNISYVFLIMAFLFLIFSETTSFGGEAYQIKRLAPRLLLVAIGITLSYYLVGWAIDFFNVLGVGIAQMTQWAIGKTGGNTLVTIEGGAIGAGIAGLLGSTGALGLGVFLFKNVGAPTLGVVALMGIFIMIAVAVTIILRQIIIIALVIVSPIAITAALLPNTEKVFKTWWSYLSKALVMYPLIIGLFAAGKIGGALLAEGAIGGAGVGDDAIKSIMSFVAGVVPLVLVPSTFKLAGGAMAGVYGAMRGGVGKAYNGMMGDARDPNSIRGRRSLGMRDNRDQFGRGTATKFANFGAGESSSKKRRAAGKGSRRGAVAKRLGINKIGTGIERVGHFSERLAQQAGERAKMTEALLAVDSGDGLGYAMGDALGGDTGGRARFGAPEWDRMLQAEKDGTLTEEESDNMEAIRQEKKGIPAEHKAAFEALRSAPMDQQKHIIQAWAQKRGGSPNGAATAAAHIQSLRDDGKINDREAAELDREYMKSVAGNGGMFLKHIADSETGQKTGGWRQGILRNARGIDGVLEEQVANVYQKDAAGNHVMQNVTNDAGEVVGQTRVLDKSSAAYKTLQKIGGQDTGAIGEFDADFMSAYLDNYSVKDADGKELYVDVDAMSNEERRMVGAFMERADINDYYRQRMDTDTRSKVYGGEGGGGGLVNRVAKGTSDYRDEDILDNEGKPTGAKQKAKFKKMIDMSARGKKPGQEPDPGHIPNAPDGP